MQLKLPHSQIFPQIQSATLKKKKKQKKKTLQPSRVQRIDDVECIF